MAENPVEIVIPNGTCDKRSDRNSLTLARQPHPLDVRCTLVGWYNYTHVAWLWPLLRRGASTPLEEEDVWRVPSRCATSTVGVRAMQLWCAEREAATKAGRSARLLRGVIVPLAWHHLVRACIASCAVAVLFTAAPVFLQRFLVALQNGADVQQLITWGLPFALCWFVITYMVTIAKWENVLCGCTCRVAVQHLIYMTCLAAPVDSIMSPENLMSVDAERYFTVLQSLFPHCFLLLCSFSVLLLFQVGIIPTAIGMGVLYLTAYAQMRVGAIIGKCRKAAMVKSDMRVRLTRQFLEGVRVLKMNGWTGLAESRLADVRKQELGHHRMFQYFRGLNTTLGLAAPCVTGFLVFSVYSILGGRMEADVVFPSLTVLRGLQLYMSMLPTIFSNVGEFATAHNRVQAFLLSLPLVEQRKHGDEQQAGVGLATISLAAATFQRGSSEMPADEARRPFVLGPLDLHLGSGELCVVCGPVGSGKTTLLLGMLGELQQQGQVGLEGRVSLCGQEPWIRSDKLRENVRCLRSWDAAAYQNALDAASLRPDLLALPAGDETEIGSRGINVSGGQKARVALARCLFGVADCDIVFLDDVLSAVDVHVARHIIDQALLGMLSEKTRVLVANTFLPLLLPHASKVVVLAADGGIDAIGSPADVLERSVWFRTAVDAMGGVKLTTGSVNDVAEEGTLDGRSCNPSGTTDLADATATVDVCAAIAAPKADGSLLVAEDRVVGVLNPRAYGSFFKDASSKRTIRSGLVQFMIIVFFVVLTEASRSASDLWILAWTNGEDSLADGEEGNRAFWIVGFALILVLLAFFGAARIIWFTQAIIAIGSRNHDRMIGKVLAASVPLFFDVVPNGRILNRFSKDLDSLDTQLPEFLFEFLQSAAYVLAAVILCISASYLAAIVVIPLLLCFIWVRGYFAAVSRELKRLEGVSRSPIYTHFAETLSGLVHIRAFNLVQIMVEEFEAKVDANAALFLHQNALIPWLMHRVNLIASILLAVVIAVSTAMSALVNPALVGLSLASGAGLLGKLHQCVQFSIQTENHFTSVERLEHFDHIAQEESSTIPSVTLELEWPSKGELEFHAVQLRYRPHLPLVLRDVSFKVSPGQRAGLIGRTGSGKSSCMLAILRMVQLSGGRVTIDGVDIASVPLKRLRGDAVAIIPQEPYLFEGSVRENLDPSGTVVTSVCEDALSATQLQAAVAAAGGLDANVENNGANFSVGQRQLLCIARAMLRRSSIVLLDEASANIDAATDVAIQRSIRTCFGKSTMLIIAHRLATIADADLVICMDNGNVVEAGPPGDLRRAGGAVGKMFQDVDSSISL
eukprot:TRINITY_DN12171_c1_g1_i1.p1 TRINITY_DN12171_c1_g1~~TRINITY_DN12171_c1_g1_i1.p1  ORF type:complete len:1315 (+),score=177.47 TRINITY_DN12171_c1_g1_i1:97-4041(+)